MAETILKVIPLKNIRENPVALREVNRTSEQYTELVDSVRKNGVLNAILVREVRNPDTGEILYGLIDGLHRFSAAQDAGLSEIPAQVRAMGDAEVLEAQVLANIHKIETKPSQYSDQLIRILSQNPLLTTAELATRLAKSPAWLNDRLGLVKLPQEVRELVDSGKINLSNAYVLAKLSVMALEEVPNWLDRAMTTSPSEFVPTCSARVKELKDAKRQGRDASAIEWVPTPHMRKIGEVKDEMEKNQAGPILIRDSKVTTTVEAFALGVKWTLHMDPKSIEIAKQRDADRKAQLNTEKEARKKEREEKKNKEAATVAAALEKV